MEAKSKKWVGLLILTSILMFLCGELAHAQIVYENTGENWVYTYDGPAHQSDYANDIEYFYGDIYVAGYSTGDGTGEDFTVISLTPDGDTNWTYRYNGPGNGDDQAKAIISGPGGNIYAAGYSTGSGTGRDFIVINLDPVTGDTNWTYRYNGSGNGNDEAKSIDYGADNHIYAGGYSSGTAYYPKDFTVIRLDTLGNEKSVGIYNGMANSNDEAYAIKVGKSSSPPGIYAVGYSDWGIGHEKDFVVVRFDTTGAVQWVQLYNGPGQGDDIAKALDLNWMDNGVYAAGYSTGDGTGKDFTVMWVDSMGAVGWLQRYNGPGNRDDEANAVVFHAYYISAAGYSTGEGTGKDYTVLTFSYAHGGLYNTYRYNGPGNGYDEARSIESWVSSSPAVYAAGYSVGGDATGRDFIVTRHTNKGVAKWVYQYNGLGGLYSSDELYSISIEGQSGQNLYAAGYSTGSSNNIDFAVISLPYNFPPTIPVLISPADSGFLNDTTSVTYTWHASDDPETSVQRYTIQYDIDSGFSSPKTFVPTDTFETVTLNDTLYYWRVKARDTNGNESDWSEVWFFSFDLTPPTTPVLISPIADAFVLDTSVAFDWTAVAFGRDVPSPVGYVLQVDTTMSFSSPIMTDSNTATATTLEFDAIDAYYYWRVKAYDVAGNQGSYSNPETFRIDITPPVIDSETVWEETSYCGPFNCFAKVTDMWGFDEVLLYYKRMEDPAWFSNTMSEGEGDWYLAQIPAGTIDNDTIKYYYYAMDNAEYEIRVPTTDHYWFIGNSTGVAEENSEIPNVFSFDVRSNLIKGKAIFNLSLPKNASIILEIYDASGRCIATPVTGKRSAGNHTITWTPETNGVYFYSLKSPWKTETGKILSIR